MEKDRKEKILDWVNLAKEVYSERSKEEMNILFDIRPVESFEISLKHTKDSKILDDKFIEMFETFSVRVVDSAAYESGSSRVVESLESIAKTICLMDLGYGIYSSILMNFGREMLEDRFNKAEVINRVYDILFRKRAAIFRLTDPYDFLYLELENMTVLTKQLLEFLKIAGLLEVLGGEKFKKQLEGLRC